jgi:hypothetical protein
MIRPFSHVWRAGRRTGLSDPRAGGGIPQNQHGPVSMVGRAAMAFGIAETGRHGGDRRGAREGHAGPEYTVFRNKPRRRMIDRPPDKFMLGNKAMGAVIDARAGNRPTALSFGGRDDECSQVHCSAPDSALGW